MIYQWICSRANNKSQGTHFKTKEDRGQSCQVAGLNTFQLELEKEMKVRDVKKVAQEECNIEPEHMRLIYNSRQLKDWDTLESYKGWMGCPRVKISSLDAFQTTNVFDSESFNK